MSFFIKFRVSKGGETMLSIFLFKSLLSHVGNLFKFVTCYRDQLICIKNQEIKTIHCVMIKIWNAFCDLIGQERICA